VNSEDKSLCVIDMYDWKTQITTPEGFFISFSPGFNRVSGYPSDFPKPFQRFTFGPGNPKTVKTVRVSKGNPDHPVETG